MRDGDGNDGNQKGNIEDGRLEKVAVDDPPGDQPARGIHEIENTRCREGNVHSANRRGTSNPKHLLREKRLVLLDFFNQLSGVVMYSESSSSTLSYARAAA